MANKCNFCSWCALRVNHQVYRGCQSETPVELSVWLPIHGVHVLSCCSDTSSTSPFLSFFSPMLTTLKFHSQMCALHHHDHQPSSTLSSCSAANSGTLAASAQASQGKLFVPVSSFNCAQLHRWCKWHHHGEAVLQLLQESNPWYQHLHRVQCLHVPPVWEGKFWLHHLQITQTWHSLLLHSLPLHVQEQWPEDQWSPSSIPGPSAQKEFAPNQPPYSTSSLAIVAGEGPSSPGLCMTLLTFTDLPENCFLAAALSLDFSHQYYIKPNNVRVLSFWHHFPINILFFTSDIPAAYQYMPDPVCYYWNAHHSDMLLLRAHPA